MWTLYREYCEANLILQTDTDFEKGIELLKETYYKKNDIFLLKMKTAADVFRGKSYSELQTWFFKYRQSARNCGLSTMTEEEQFNFKLLASMTEKMKTTLFIQNAIPPGDIKLHRQSGDRGEHDKVADKEGRHSQQCHRGPREADKDQVLGL